MGHAIYVWLFEGPLFCDIVSLDGRPICLGTECST